MDGMEAVIDAPEVGVEVETESQHGVSTPENDKGNQVEQHDDPYSSKASKEYSQWLKNLKDSDPNNAKFARLSKDNHSRLFELQKMEPRGIEGIREKYAMLDSVMHGELKGVEAIGAIQDQLREVAQTDELLAAGDPKALEALGDEFNEGLAKLTPTILERIQQSNPEAYAAAVLPHFVQALASSQLVQNHNAIVDVLNEQPPKWLPPDKMNEWREDRNARLSRLVGSNSDWLNAQAARAGEIMQPAQSGKVAPDKLQEERAAFEKQQQDHHWSTNISPKLDNHAAQKFSEEFRPFAKRLNLDAAAANNLKMEFSRRVANLAAKDKAYMAQIQRYRSAKNPDPASVVNFAKVEFNKHSKTVMEQLINERYKGFLSGKPRIAQQQTEKSGNTVKPAPGIQMVTVRPPENMIDHKRRTTTQIHDKIFPLKNGKVVQLQK